MSFLPLLLCSALTALDDDRVGSARQGSLLVCPPVGIDASGALNEGQGQSNIAGGGAEAELLLVHDHPNDIAIRLLVRGSSGQYERFEPLPGDTIRTFDLLDLLAPLNASQGHVVVVACNLQGEPIAHNQLSGSVRFQGFSDTAELPVAAFRAIAGTTGDALPTPEHLSLDGVEYAVPGNRQVLDFYAVGSSPVMGQPVRTQLGVVPLDFDFTARNPEPSSTQLRFEIWNENEVKFSGTTHCFEGMGWVDLADLNGPTNHFRRQFLGTDSGKARLDTIANPSCGDRPAAPALVAWVLNDFGVGTSGRMLRSTGRQPSAFHIPTMSAPEESGVEVDNPDRIGDDSGNKRDSVPAR